MVRKHSNKHGTRQFNFDIYLHKIPNTSGTRVCVCVRTRVHPASQWIIEIKAGKTQARSGGEQKRKKRKKTADDANSRNEIIDKNKEPTQEHKTHAKGQTKKSLKLIFQ